MSNNPFNDSLDWALQGKYARVYSSSDHVFEGWIERVHHKRGSIILHDAHDPNTGDDLGSVFVRTAEVVTVLQPKKRIEYRQIDSLTPYPEYDHEFEPKDRVMRSCYRNQFAGGFPVIREDGTILNGHKRVAACEAVGLAQHPVEVVDVTDEQAAELFSLAHPDQTDPHSDDTNPDDTDTDAASDTETTPNRKRATADDSEIIVDSETAE